MPALPAISASRWCLLGILMLIGGIIYHVQFMIYLREQRKEMMAAGLVYGESKFPLSLTLATA